MSEIGIHGYLFLDCFCLFSQWMNYFTWSLPFISFSGLFYISLVLLQPISICNERHQLVVTKLKWLYIVASKDTYTKDDLNILD
jgi:hypothetical protein